MICEEFSSITSHSPINVSRQNVVQFENAIYSFLKNCPPETFFLAAVSGGADSIAMLTALCAVICKERLCCIHVEHGIRQPEESRGDADFVRSYCKKLGIKCRIVSIPQGKIAFSARRKGTGIEAAARFFRRKALFGEALKLGENTRILIAHTKDDLLETALMRVLRGCGPAGLAAMPAEKRENNKEQRIILRPLLSVSREDVIGYLKVKGISWREDSTNTDEKLLRNRIRRRLVPLLNETFPSWKTGISNMAETQSFAADFIAAEAKQRIRWEFVDKPLNFHPTLPVPCFSTDEEFFFTQPLIIREEALFLAIDRLLKGKKNINSIKRSVVRRFCEGKVNAADLGPVIVKREKGKIISSRKQKDFFESGTSLLI